MTSIAKLKQKEQEAFRKLTSDHRTKLKKLDEASKKNVFKILKSIKFFDADLSDEELSAGFKKMLEDSGKVVAVTPSKALMVGPVKPSQPDVPTS